MKWKVTEHLINAPEHLPEGRPVKACLGDQELDVTWNRKLGTLVFHYPDYDRNIKVLDYRITNNSDDGSVLFEGRLDLGKDARILKLTFLPDLPGLEQRLARKLAQGATVKSQITGKVLSIHCKDGDQVDSGLAVLVVEAMKMENKILAPVAGVLSKLNVSVGDAVTTGQVLFKVTPEQKSAET